MQPFAARLSASTPNRSGVYFLLHEDEVVYIGQATSIVARVRAHPKTKEFVDVLSMLLCEEDLNKYEGALCRYFGPRLGKAWPRETQPGDDVAVWSALGLDPSLAKLPSSSRAASEMARTEVFEEDEDEQDEDEDEDACTYHLFSDSPLVPLCLNILFGYRWLEHQKCDGYQCSCTSDEHETGECRHRCSCPLDRLRGAVLNSLLESCGWDGWDNVSDAYVDDAAQVIYVTWDEYVKNRFKFDEMVLALMDELDEDGPWAVVFRCHDDPKGKYWTIDHHVFDPRAGYEPPMEAIINALHAFEWEQRGEDPRLAYPHRRNDEGKIVQVFSGPFTGKHEE